MAVELLAHLGLNKTATSSVRRYLEAEHPQFAGRPYGAVDFAERDLFGAVGQPDAYRDAIGVKRRDGHVALVDERMVAPPWTRRWRAVDTVEILRRFHAAVPEARVLVTVRRQPALLRSQYLQTVATGYPGTWDDFLSEQIEAMSQGWVGTVDFLPVIETLHGLFPPERVRFAVFEDLVKHPEAFWHGLHQWTGDPFFATATNLPHRNATRLAATRLDVALNRRVLRSTYRRGGVISRRAYNSLSARLPQMGRAIEFESPASAALLDSILRRVAEGNRRMASLAGVDVERLGYCCG